MNLPAGAVTLAALALLGCAKIEPPPGGPPDTRPPGLAAALPESLAVLPDFSGEVEFLFNETVSEGNSPNMGIGTGDLEQLVILSPTERVPKVRWKRSRVTVQPAEGWQPDRVYRVQLLPGVMDIRRNRTDTGTVVTFTTGAPIPTLHLTGRVWDWTTARPAIGALVEAVLLPDSLRYRMLSDSTGRFDLGPLPAGSWVVFAGIDQNRNRKLDPREAWDSASVPADSAAVRELWVFPHDTIGPRIARTAVLDSVTATITFNQPLAPGQRFGPPAVRALQLPDSVASEVLSLLPKAQHDSAYPRAAAPADTGARPKAPADTVAPPRAPAAPQKPPTDTLRPAREALETALLLRVREPWKAGAIYLIEVDSVRNPNGATSDTRGPLEIPKAKPDSAVKDSTAEVQPPARPPNQQ